MASETLNTIVSGSPGHINRVAVEALSQQNKVTPTKVTSEPKVAAPKPIDIKFDPAEVRQTLQEAVSFLNKQLNENNRGLGFSLDEALDRPIVTVRSTVTGEVVRQIPNEAVVRIAHNIENIKGLIINANA